MGHFPDNYMALQISVMRSVDNFFKLQYILSLSLFLICLIASLQSNIQSFYKYLAQNICYFTIDISVDSKYCIHEK